MAKYTYQYACGHGTGVVSLFGKNAERERKLAWYADNMVCPDCYKLQKQQEDNEAEKVAVIKYRTADIPLFSVIVHGQIEQNKESLKALGFSLEEDYEAGILGMLSMKKPPLAWQRTFQAKNEAELLENIQKVASDIIPLGYQFKDEPVNVLDLNFLKFQWQKIAEREATKPKENGCYDFMKERHGKDLRSWNGKIYGKKGGYNYYINNVKFDMTDEQQQAIETYRTAMREWKEKYNNPY